MPTLKQIIFASLLVCALLATAAAQDSTTTQGSSLTITAAAAGERVRITAPASVVQMQVEVYAASGEKVFDQEIRGGNVFDWHLQDGQAQRLAPGTYVCVVTAKSISGRLTQKLGTVSVAEKSVSVQAADSRQLSAAQAQPIGPVEENPSWTIAAPDEPQTPTVIANDGTDGQMIRGRGALTFRIGNFFSGLDTEQMRLTEAGNLGIGTSEPKAKLEVAGTIRAERFLIAKPKLVSVDKLSTNTLATDAVDSVQPLVAGTGTQNQIAKWTDNVGTLGDSGITQNNVGFVGIGTTSPTTKLHIFGAETDDTYAGMGVDPFSPTGGALNFGMGGHSWGRGSGFINVRRTADGTLPTFRFMTNGIERIFIDQAGNVGIGTTTPTNGKLDVSTSSGTAVFGGSSIATGVHGFSTSPTGYGVVGFSNNYGVLGQSSSGVGVRAQSDSGVGLRAESVSGNLLEGYDGSNTRKFFFANNGTLNLPANGLVAGTDQLVLSNGKVGIGTSTPTARLTVVASTGQVGIFGQSPLSTGVAGNSITGFGVVGESIAGPGVTGFSDSGSGVVGESSSGPALVASSATGNLVEGYVGGITFSNRRFHITIAGTYVAGSDFAEALPARGDRAAYEPGDVLVISTKAPGKVEKASQPYDPRVAGVYSTRPGMLGADKNGTSRVDKDDVPVAIVGIVPTKASAMYGKIRVGDLLTTSSTPGYAMRCVNRVKCVGAIVGKALEPLAKGKGVIKMLVMLR